ncbi:pentapeptide repeat-containing protein [Pigmentibacter sp. JX0631]|uniref:pentapeptide repeat-containing protein n=1 Tax=Pigmentibacter sp. JX0631 TaxID=2976982 RepID=UPI0024690B5D|nr:pentapeptide repeat-containing protein [Pigmentibacter sp. JX0631]WGL58793.1 pentapeptide repeat-containing protein [Pigmentibacter sp. JX0631]
MNDNEILKSIGINKEETDTYIKYVLYDKNNRNLIKSKELLITAHGGYHSATRQFRADKKISFFSNHGYNLVSEGDSTLRRVTQARAIARETYFRDNYVVNYNLSDVSDHKGYYLDKYYDRKDFIKIIMFESYLYSVRNVYERQKIFNRISPDLILSACPDILMVKASTNLLQVLLDPKNADYEKIFCSFCRGSGSGSPSMRATSIPRPLGDQEVLRIEAVVKSEIQSRGIAGERPSATAVPLVATATSIPIGTTGVAGSRVGGGLAAGAGSRVGGGLAAGVGSRVGAGASGVAASHATARSIPVTPVIEPAKRAKDFRNRDFSYQTLNASDLSNADLSGANFNNAILRNVNLTGSVLSWAKFDQTIFNNTSLWNCDLDNTNFDKARFSFENMTINEIINNSDPVVLATKAQKWSTTSYLPLGDSKDLGFNVMIPTIFKLEDIREPGLYRFVILPNGEIRIGYEDNRKNETQIWRDRFGRVVERRNIVTNFTQNGKTEICSHGGLCDYQKTIAAGVINIGSYFGRNYIISITNQSGHYKPNKESLFIAGIIIQNKYPTLINRTRIEAMSSDHRGRSFLEHVGTIN